MHPLHSALLATVALGACGRIAFEPADATDTTDAGDAPWPTLAGTWTWMAGSNFGEQPGSYGTRGVSSPSNYPGPRENGGSWGRADGSMWLFGGYGIGASVPTTGRLDDLWRFDSSTGLWTWMHGGSAALDAGVYGLPGVPDPANHPGGRNDATGWVDETGDLSLFGGNGHDAIGCLGALNDLWRYGTGTGQWTWIAGSSMCNQPGVYGARGVPDTANIPGARGSPASWTSPSGVWMYGGDGIDRVGTLGRLSDLWHYDAAGNVWTWIDGSDVADQLPVHGAIGVASPTSHPGSRTGGCAWAGTDELWLFGGGATDGLRNDLWRYTISTGVWTWVAGSIAIQQPGSYATRGVPDPTSAPGARVSVSCWLDGRGNLWLFGGEGRDGTGALGSLSDLWVYMPGTGQWTWVAGNDLVNQVGRYGTLGVPDTLNAPGGRAVGASWARADGSLWLFGGDFAFDSIGQTRWLGDLWRFGP